MKDHHIRYAFITGAAMSESSSCITHEHQIDHHRATNHWIPGIRETALPQSDHDCIWS